MDSWYLLDRSTSPIQPVGPFPFEEMRRRVAAGEVDAATLVARAGSSEWIPAGSDPGLLPLLLPAPPTEFITPSGMTSLAAGSLGGSIPPYSFAAAFSTATAAVRSQWATLVLMGLVATAAWMAISIPGWVLNMLGQFARTGGNAAEAGFLALLATVVNLVLNLLIGGPLYAGLIHAAARTVEGRGRIEDLFAGFRRWGAAASCYLLLGLISTGIVVVVMVPLIVLIGSDLLRFDPARWDAGEVLTLVAVGVGAFLLFVLVMTRVILAPGIVADPAFGRIGPMQAIQLSWRATGGRTWSIFALLLVTGVIASLTIFLLCVGWVLLGVPLILATYGAVHLMVNRPLAAAPSV